MFCKFTEIFMKFALWMYKKAHLKKETDKCIIGYKVSPMYKVKTIRGKTIYR